MSIERSDELLTYALEFGLEILLVPTVGDVEEKIWVLALQKLSRWDSGTDAQHRCRAISSWLAPRKTIIRQSQWVAGSNLLGELSAWCHNVDRGLEY